jgi:hypothetical protein
MTSSTISPQPVSGVAPPLPDVARAAAAGHSGTAGDRGPAGLTLGAGSRVPARLLALTPTWMFVALSLLDRGYIPALLEVPPDLVGLPLGMAVTAIAVAWMLVGAALVWRAPSALVQSLGLLAFTIPATIVVAFAPVAILAARIMG